MPINARATFEKVLGPWDCDSYQPALCRIPSCSTGCFRMASSMMCNLSINFGFFALNKQWFSSPISMEILMSLKRIHLSFHLHGIIGNLWYSIYQGKWDRSSYSQQNSRGMLEEQHPAVATCWRLIVTLQSGASQTAGIIICIYGQFLEYKDVKVRGWRPSYKCMEYIYVCFIFVNNLSTMYGFVHCSLCYFGAFVYEKVQYFNQSINMRPARIFIVTSNSSTKHMTKIHNMQKKCAIYM